MALCLLPLSSLALDRARATEIVACDATPEFGFGVMALPCSQDQAAESDRLSEKRNDLVKLHRRANDPPDKERIGHPYNPLCAEDC